MCVRACMEKGTSVMGNTPTSPLRRVLPPPQVKTSGGSFQDAALTSTTTNCHWNRCWSSPAKCDSVLTILLSHQDFWWYHGRGKLKAKGARGEEQQRKVHIWSLLSACLSTPATGLTTGLQFSGIWIVTSGSEIVSGCCGGFSSYNSMFYKTFFIHFKFKSMVLIFSLMIRNHSL